GRRAEIVRLDNYADINNAFAQLDSAISDPQLQATGNTSCVPLWTNRVSDLIHQLVMQYVKATSPSTGSTLPVSSTITSLLFVGGSETTPPRFVPDEAGVANERQYDPTANTTPINGTMLPGLRGGLVSTYDFYASFRSQPWRGRSLPVPEAAI